MKGQQAQVAEALLKYGYLDKEFALINLKIRSLGEIVRRLRLKGWPIDTNEENPSRLYTLRRTLKHDARVITTAINEAIALNKLAAAQHGAETLVSRIKAARRGES